MVLLQRLPVVQLQRHFATSRFTAESFRFHDAAKRLEAKRLSSETTRHRLNASAMQPDWFASCQSGVINIVMFVYLIELF